MRRMFATGLMALVILLGIAVTPATAGDGRAATTKAELRAVLHHTMGRSPD